MVTGHLVQLEAKRDSERMSSRFTRTERARQLRDFLRSQFGGHCHTCGSTNQLEMHLKVSDGGKHHGMSFVDRIHFYASEHDRQNLLLLCSACHRRVSASEARHRRLARVATCIS